MTSFPTPAALSAPALDRAANAETVRQRVSELFWSAPPPGAHPDALAVLREAGRRATLAISAYCATVSAEVAAADAPSPDKKAGELVDRPDPDESGANTTAPARIRVLDPAVIFDDSVTVEALTGAQAGAVRLTDETAQHALQMSPTAAAAIGRALIDAANAADDALRLREAQLRGRFAVDAAAPESRTP